MDMLQVTVRKNDMTSFLVCLAVGTLVAIREQKLPSTAGIWSLGAPSIWSKLENEADVPETIVEVFQTLDELHAIELLMPEKFRDEIDKLIVLLFSELSRISDPEWRAEVRIETKSIDNQSE